MDERKRNRQPEERPNEALFTDRVAFDALKYIKLMRKKSPESLILNSTSGLNINISDAPELFVEAFEYLGIQDPEEKISYLNALHNKVMELIQN